METLFELAAKKKYRFDDKGWISVEELWDMNPQQLDAVFRWLNKLKASNEGESLIGKSRDVDLDNKIQIVKYIFEKGREEEKEKEEEQKRQRRRAMIREILDEKCKDNLYDLSKDELKKMMSDLDRL